MTDLRTAAQQALEALEDHAKQYPHMQKGYTVDAITALRAALAQQAEPDAYGYASRVAVSIWQWNYKDTAPNWKPLDDLMGVLNQIDNMTSGLTRRAQQAEPVEPVAHRVVAGALFDFMGWLTSRRERLVLSSIDDAAPAVDAIKDFAEMRGLSLDDAKVQDWNAALAQQAERVEPNRWEGDHDIESPNNACMHKGYCMVEIHRLRAERDALAERLREVRALLADTTDAHRKHVVMNAWAEQKLARHGIPMPEAPACPDCHGVGYDASGQLCACQENPSF